MKPLVSVVISTYKRSVTLKRVLESVLSQSYDNIEIVVVDDNNPDTVFRADTERLMDKYSQYDNITYLKHPENRGGSAARNTGLKVSKGKYITFLDDDDEISNEKISKQVECLENADESYGACYTAYKLIKSENQYQISSECRSGDVYIPALMRTMFMGSGSNLLLKKSVVDEIGGYDETFVRNQDIEFLVRVTEHKKLAFVNELLLVIHQDDDRDRGTFEKSENYSEYYLEKFAPKIDALPERDRKRVYKVISLERARMAVSHKKYKSAVNLLIENRVGFIATVKYFIYIIDRVITKKSYGFYLK